MSILNAWFDRVLVIHRADRPDRAESFERAAEPHGLKFSYVPGYTLDDLKREGLVAPDFVVEGDGPNRGTAGRIGCHISHHRAVLQGCYRQERLLIFEDDAVLASPEEVEAIFPPPSDIEMLFLGVGLHRGRREYRDGWYRWTPGPKQGWWGMWAYGFMTLEAQFIMAERLAHVTLGNYQDTAIRNMGISITSGRPRDGVCRQSSQFNSDTKQRASRTV